MDACPGTRRRICARYWSLSSRIFGALHLRRPIQLDLPDQPVPSWIDPDAFAIVVRNLVENALKHGAPGRPVGIVLSVTGTLSVRNQGPVLPDDELERLTKPFERGATTAKGSGLGLAIVEAIVRGAGSVLTLRSPVPGWQDGLQVTIDGLPLAPARPMREKAGPA
jgi:two-component system, OmpR family, sensor kinase